MAASVLETEIDGVPAVYAPSAGPIAAGLVFRVGQADETLARRGVTHLIEHLALHRTGLTDYHYNGVTCDTTTTFHMQGSESDVVGFLRDVCEGLRNLPFDRMETEKSLLRAEAAGKERPSQTEIPMWRYGSRGYGLVSYPEFGLPMLDADYLVNWVRNWFTKENCALWITGPVLPSEMRLPLPTGGRRQPLPAVTSALPVTPAYFMTRTNGFVVDAVVPRGAPAMLYSRVLERELFRALRQEGGYSYQTSVSYDPRDQESAIVTALADALPDQQSAVLGGLIDVLMKLDAGRIEPEDVQATLVKATEAMTHPDIEPARLPGYAMNLLMSDPIVRAGEYLDRLRAVTTTEIRDVAREVMRSALLMTPAGQRADWAGFAPAPTCSDGMIAGRRYPAIGHDDAFLMVGPAGVSVAHDERSATVRFDRCSLMLAWPDGGRHLAGQDGIWAEVEPTLFAIDPAVIAMLDAAVDPAAVVRMPPRKPADIPSPPQPEANPQPVPAPPVRKEMSPWGFAARITLIVLTVLMAGLSALCTGIAILDPGTTKDERDGGWILAGTTWFCLAVFLVPAIFAVRQVIRSRRRA